MRPTIAILQKRLLGLKWMRSSRARTNGAEDTMDLVTTMKSFLLKLPELLGPEADRDKEIVAAVSNRGMELEQRQKLMVSWLRLYAVLRYFPSESATGIAKAVLNYADALPPNARVRDQDAILSSYRKLNETLLPFARRTRSDQAISMTSLTSKALWCCYPQDVPIFDSYASCALRVLSRLCDITVKSTLKDYEAFVSAWFALYERVEPFLDQADLSYYPYKVRVFDRLLWDLGQPSF
jgi:hypothetical protein